MLTTDTEYITCASCALADTGETVRSSTTNSTMRELGHQGSRTCLGLAVRSGSGAIKHMETKFFFFLAAAEEKNQELRIEWIRGAVNPADFDDEESGWKAFDNAV